MPDWKQSLLKSSLPLEMLVAERLTQRGFFVTGEYAYTRVNEKDVDTEFSVDLHAFQLVNGEDDSWGILNVLVECKYNHHNVTWVFTPHPTEEAQIAGTITHLEDLCTRRIEKKAPLYDLDNTLLFCTRGVELHEKDFDPNSITRGLHQLRYALPDFVAQEALNQLSIWNKEDLEISLICPILVTTANIYVLKRGLGLDVFQSANDLGDVAEEVDALIVYQEPGPQLLAQCEKIARKLRELHPEIEQRLNEASQILDPGRSRFVPPASLFDDEFESACTRIVVVRFDKLDAMLSKIQGSVLEAGESIKEVVDIQIDLAKRERHIVPLP